MSNNKCKMKLLPIFSFCDKRKENNDDLLGIETFRPSEEIDPQNYPFPIIVINEKYYDKILSFLNMGKNVRSKKTRNRENRKINDMNISNHNIRRSTIRDSIIKNSQIKIENIRNNPNSEKINSETTSVQEHIRNNNTLIALQENNENINQIIENEKEEYIEEEKLMENVEQFIEKYNEYKNLLKKLIKNPEQNKFNLPQSENKKDEIFFACAQDPLTIYNEEEINDIIVRLKESGDIFIIDFDKSIRDWAENIFEIIKDFVEIKLNHKIIKYDGEKYPSLYIDKKSELFPEDFSHLIKNKCWSIIYHSEGNEINKIYDEIDYLEEEINCNLFITNNKTYLTMLIELIKKQNIKQYKKGIKKRFALLLKSDCAKETLNFFQENSYFIYFDDIKIINDSNKKIELDVTSYKNVKIEYINDKNKLILFFKKNHPYYSTIKVNKVISFNKYNSNYISLHEKIAQSYRNFLQDEKQLKKVFEEFLYSLYEKEYKEDFIENLKNISNILINEHNLDAINELYMLESKESFDIYYKYLYIINTNKEMDLILSKFRKILLNKEYEKNLNSISNYLSTKNLDLKIKLSKDNYEKLEIKTSFINNEIKKNFEIHQLKSQILLKSIEDTFESINIPSSEKYKIIMEQFCTEEESFYQDFNFLLRKLDNQSYDAIKYFIAEMIYLINEHGTLLEGEHTLYRGLKMSFAELLLFKKNEGDAIVFPSFTSNSLDKNESEKYSGINEISKKEIEERKEKGIFSVMMNIYYNSEMSQEKLCFNMNEFSKDNNLFLPFSFFHVKKVEIDIEKYIAIIDLIAINRKEILEKYINENSKIYYDDIHETVEIKKVKNVLVHCTDSRHLYELSNICKFLEERIDGTFLITNTNEYFKIILEQIKNEPKNKDELLIKFELILFESSAIEIINYIKENKYKKYFDNIIIMSADNEKYVNEVNNGFVSTVLSSKVEVTKFIREKCIGSLYSLQICDLITMTKYYRKYNLFHEIISNNYRKITDNYYGIAEDILKDYLLTKNPNLQNEDLIKSLNVFRGIDNKNPLRGLKKIIKKYTAEDGSFYQDFNNWLRNPDPDNIEKIGYFISSFIYSLNEYGRMAKKGLIGEHHLFRGLKLSFADLIFYSMNIKNIICFLSPTSTTIDEKIAENFSEIGKNKGQYATIMRIYYNCNNNHIPNVIDITDVSEYDEEERLFLPFSFFRIKDVLIKEEEKKAFIDLEVINRENINEEKLSQYGIIKYNKQKNIIECTNNKIVIYDVEDNTIETKIFGEEFIKNNEDRLKLIIENKEIDLCGKYLFKSKGRNLIEIKEKKPLKNTCSMFNDCICLHNLDVFKNWDMSRIKDTNSMFNGCFSITSIEALKKWNMSNCVNMSYMFENCYSNTSIDALKNWNMSKVKNTSFMFCECSSITNIDSLKNWDMSNVKDTNYMFYGCSSINNIDALKNWNMKNVINTSDMFCGCSSLTSINSLNNWNLKNVKNASHMFSNCKNITSILKCNLSKDANTNGMYSGCSVKIIDVFGSIKAAKEFGNIIKEKVEQKKKNDVIENINEEYEKYIKKNKNIKKVTYYTENLNWDWNEINIFGEEFVQKNKENIIINIEGEKMKIRSKYKLKKYRKNTIEIIEKEEITDFSNMFNNCKTLSSIEDLENWNLEKVTNISYMFQSCISLSSIIPLKNWNTKNIINTSGMFWGCKSLSNIDILQNWNMENLKKAEGMFYDCTSLLSIKSLSFWNFKNLIDTSDMFRNCSSLISIDAVENWNMSNVSDISGMFRECSKINSVNALKNWDVINVIDASDFLCSCISINSIDGLKNWNTENFIKVRRMFKGCSFTSVDALKNWNMKNVENTSYMFYDCFCLNSIAPIRKWNMKNVVNTSYMFYNCKSLKSVEVLKSWKMKNITNADYMFEGCAVNAVDINDILKMW